jgi:octaheme c-type cytochrome (tetrathionate reductase family)
MKHLPLLLVALSIGLVLFIAALKNQSPPHQTMEGLKRRYTEKHIPSVDHAKLAPLQKKFSSAREVTLACISCHTERHKEVMQSSHWNWEREEYIEGRGIRSIGKKNILNNFCIGISSNEESCNKCHIGYSWIDSTFDFTDAGNVDCLVCHDNSNTYVKGSHGLPDSSVNLTNVAQHVGRPLRTNCGTCHFFGGGGNNVKHGDLEQALFSTTRDVDVHMAADGEDMQCVDCHTATNHRMLGKMYSVSSMNRNRSSCEQCHTDAPHADGVLNDHIAKIACQTCHIPEYAKVHSTKMAWDWSTAGRLRNGQPYEEDDSLGNHTYMSIKGSFAWGRHVRPEYVWFNGTAGHYLVGDTASVMPIRVNSLNGRYDDPDARIIPVKIHRTKQPYDPVNHWLIQPRLYASQKGQGAFWKDFDWNRAAEEGMKAIHLPFSGELSFASTEMTWPVNHMVSPKSAAVACSECHTREGGRLAALRDFYMPGRDYHPAVEQIGTGMMLVTIAGVAVHASLRLSSGKRRKEPRP